MQKANETNLPRTSRTIKINPDQLRMIAEKLEVASRNALPGEQVHYDVTPHLSFYYDPEISAYSAVAEIKRIEQ